MEGVQIVPWNPQRHFQSLCAWSTQRGIAVMDPGWYPTTGAVAIIDDLPVAALFLWTTNSNRGIIDDAMSDPGLELNPLQKLALGRELLGCLLVAARSLGICNLVTTTSNPFVERLLIGAGFQGAAPVTPWSLRLPTE